MVRPRPDTFELSDFRLSNVVLVCPLVGLVCDAVDVYKAFNIANGFHN